MIDRCDFKSNE